MHDDPNTVVNLVEKTPVLPRAGVFLCRSVRHHSYSPSMSTTWTPPPKLDVSIDPDDAEKLASDAIDSLVRNAQSGYWNSVVHQIDRLRPLAVALRDAEDAPFSEAPTP